MLLCFLAVEMELHASMKERIMIFDGGMGTMLQQHRFTEDDFRGAEFKDHPKNLKGNNDLLCLTKPDVVYEIHKVTYKPYTYIPEAVDWNLWDKESF